MVMKKFIIQFVILIIVVFGALAIATSKINNLPFSPPQLKTGTVYINDTKINVEIADTAAARSKGLGGRTSIASDSGMLFQFDKPGKYAFWMKGMQFPLDFIWIRANRVADLQTNLQPPSPGQSDQQLPVYEPNQVVDMILEVNSGFVEKHDIKIGDLVRIII